MYSSINTAALVGIQSIPITVEVDLSPGLPVFDMVGNLTVRVREGKERVKTALHQLGVLLPAKRITVNFSPARIKKDGTLYDLPLAVGILTSLGIIEEQKVSQYLFAGELNLKGELLPVNGILPIVSDAMLRGQRKFIFPAGNVREAGFVKNAEVLGFSTLQDLVSFFQTDAYQKVVPDDTPGFSKVEEKKDFCDVSGQYLLKRAAEISAAGMHNLLFIGPPGSGKTMIAERFPTILPPLTEREQFEISKIYSIRGLLQMESGLVGERPFRSPHHTVTKAAMAGGGIDLMPGEISLSHTGVLFLDELTEFQKDILEILRQPLEDRKIQISRMGGSVEYPSDFLLLAAMNPCNCGYYPDMQLCKCTPSMRRRYYNKLSQPLIDRIDLFVHAQPLSFTDLTQKQEGESSQSIRERVEECQLIQVQRYRNEPFCHNSQIPSAKIREYCKISEEDEVYMQGIYASYRLTGRTFHKILRVARTIADLKHSKSICHEHLQEALIYRNPDEFQPGEVSN